jgi:hypothetical protein
MDPMHLGMHSAVQVSRRTVIELIVLRSFVVSIADILIDIARNP